MEDKKSLKLAYHDELVQTIDLIGCHCKSTITIDGLLLNFGFYDEFGGRYEVTIEADDEYKLYNVCMWFNAESRFRSSFTNVSLVREVVEMLLKRYAD